MRILRREKARIAERIIISGIHKRRVSFYPSILHDFPNHFSILLHLSAILILLPLNKEILLSCLIA